LRVVVLECASHDLGRGGRVAVDEHDHGNAVDHAGARPVRREPLDVVGAAADEAHDLAAAEECAGHGDHLAARISAQVQDQARESIRTGLAAVTTCIVSSVPGDADVLVVPDLVSGNMLAKQLVHLAGA
jgi:hypothetical protein